MSARDTKAPALLSTDQSIQQNDERPCTGTEAPKANSTTYERMREQQACRDEWVRLFGKDAELTSRGGTTWL